MELEGDVQGRQDQAQKIIEMPQRDRETSTSENQPSSASVVSMYGQERPSVSSLHQQLASASGTQTIQLREELVLAVAQNASAQATAFEAEVKDKLEEAKETVSHKVAEVSQMAHSMAGLSARVIEFCGLADHNRTGADDFAMDEEHDHAGQQCGNDGYVGYDAGNQSRTEQRHRNKFRHDVQTRQSGTLYS